MASTVREELQEALDSFKAAKGDGKVTPGEWIKFGGECAGVMERAAQNFTGTDAEFESLIVDCEHFVREFIVKPDLPFVNDFVENVLLDPQLVRLVRPALEAVRKKL